MKKPKLNARQAQVIKRIVEGSSATQAYKKVYKTPTTAAANANATRMLAKDSVRNALEEAMRKKGIDEGSIADTLIEMKHNRDWRSKESFVDRAARFLGHDPDKNGNVSRRIVAEEFFE